ncbi:ATPase [Rhodoligotrophos defluvii]|uniref:ATPase n=1 Tax=Rhodoligotrophos defluvii TaxID=2561934 RepID=UPI0010C9E333|nr:ATPase [Rhodoligotrophos defluvii]
MRFPSGSAFLAAPAKAVTVFGMSGVGKTRIGRLLREAQWFHYSVDYRIATRYMENYIVDNVKREAMKNPVLRGLLLSDSIYIRSNVTFANLEPLSVYLGKPGNPAKGGLPFEEYRRRQNQHRRAEIRSMLDVPEFIEKAQDIYGYNNFVADASGSLCEVVDPDNPADAVLKTVSEATLMIYVRGTEAHARMLTERFKAAPKPMYYQDAFLLRKWAEYKTLTGCVRDDDVDPDGFAIWGFEQLLHHRMPLYQRIADNFGYVVEADDVAGIGKADEFLALVAETIDRQA